jgi:hypothetical protein
MKSRGFTELSYLQDKLCSGVLDSLAKLSEGEIFVLVFTIGTNFTN